MKAFERIVTMEAAFDRRHADPSKNYGIHGVELRMKLRGPDGEAYFTLFTSWHLPEVQRELDAKACRGQFPLLAHKPMPAYFGFHGVHPQYQGHDVCQEACEHFGGRPCYDSNSATAAEGIFEILLREGSEGVWKALEERYYEASGVDVEAETGVE